MAWTAPRTWIDQEVVTEANFNTHIRDNFLALDQHAHGGAAGAGASSLGNLVKGTFTDASAPAAPGSGKTVVYAVSGRPTYRAGSAGASTRLADANDLHAQTHASTHQPSGADTMAVDAAAGTGSLRTLGTGATQGAVGSHTHPPSTPNVQTHDGGFSGDTDSESVVATTTFTPQGPGLSVALVATFLLPDGGTNTYTIRLKHGSTVIASAVELNDSAQDLVLLQGLQTTAAESSTAYTATVQRITGSTLFNTKATIVAREITKTT
jgi:hypothetical protein